MSDGGAAFPLPVLVMGQGSNEGLGEAIASALGAQGARGMSMRDYFAGQALAGFAEAARTQLAHRAREGTDATADAVKFGEYAFAMADGMLAARAARNASD